MLGLSLNSSMLQTNTASSRAYMHSSANLQGQATHEPKRHRDVQSKASTKDHRKGCVAVIYKCEHVLHPLAHEH